MHNENKQEIKILKINKCLQTIWETIERNRTKENKCIIKDMISWKIS